MMVWHVFSRMTWKGRRYFFNLVAANGERVLQSEAYFNKADALAEVGKIKLGAAEAVVEIGQRPA